MNPLSTAPAAFLGYGGEPAALAAQIALNPGDSINLSDDALRNTTGKPILIDSFFWLLDSLAVPALVFDATPALINIPNTILGSGVEIGLALGDQKITSSLVPIYLLGESEGQVADQIAPVLYQHGLLADLTAFGSFASGIWRFSRPMVVQPGQSISARLLHRGLVTGQINATLSFAGRTVSAPRGPSYVPFFSSWVPPALNWALVGTNAPLVINSTEQDLANVSGGPVEIERFTGRLMRIGAAVPAGINVGLPSIVSVIDQIFYPGGMAHLVERLCTMTLRSSTGEENVAVDTPFRQVFEPVTRSWYVPHTLDDRGYYIARITLNPPPASVTINDLAIQPSISMVGSREV